MVIDKNKLIKVDDCDIVNGEFVVPDGVTAIAEGLFLDCKLLVSIVIPESVNSIGNVAFDICESLKNYV